MIGWPSYMDRGSRHRVASVNGQERAQRPRSITVANDSGSPFGHVCTPEEVASVVHALVTDVGTYLTGIKITVDGGTF